MSFKQLELVRAKIDEVDKNLVELLKKRQDLVVEAASLKKDLDVSAYSHERQTYVLSHVEEIARSLQLPQGLLSDIMKRVLRESYKLCSGTDFNYPRCLKESGDVVIVGGNGGMGRIFASYFENSGYKVFSFGHRGWDKAPEYLKTAKIVIVSVPIDITIDVIKRLSPMLKSDQILCDFTSVKGPIVEAMMQYHKGPVLGLHPMFGPDVKSLVKQVVVTVPERDEKASQFLVEQLRIWGATICKCSAKEHDEAMSIIQALRHFSTYSYGTFLQKIAPKLQKLKDLSSPIYRLELMMVGRLFAQDPRLYADIIMSSEANYELIKSFVESVTKELEVIKNKDKISLLKSF
ncbi:MAG: bifunctional chorismate mutase/prephenate dehydrogenase [Succinivibrio sp.]|nr:bifunctional chorismate mutase/prephenate dehydrogenase [Succinivibrio sp.]